MIEDLLQLGLIYHTLKYTVDDLSSGPDLRGNLLLPYCSATNEERFRLENWIRELRGESISEPKGENDLGLTEWTYTCMLMYLLPIGYLEQEATALLTIFGSDYDRMVYTIERENHGEPSPFFKKVKLCGELLIEPFSSWVDGKQYLRRE
ncbi:hypothetical protein BGW36DRAFT_407755 [Talaromyces proteolyticus]|uniref:Uncharacterized protein n=1 Tax=Talaromyces proteolyticus TaxID=1131652 RepID=A0AAD4KRX6_9EURO|nr:uncharacterized protein BGW36DRAFT_407755 [Talaromyces proteolyticus]KAH8697811.1 hypothetical protein BGW36DRAFT_407755 [Talaromyces proteolyticus]